MRHKPSTWGEQFLLPFSLTFERLPTHIASQWPTLLTAKGERERFMAFHGVRGGDKTSLDQLSTEARAAMPPLRSIPAKFQGPLTPSLDLRWGWLKTDGGATEGKEGNARPRRKKDSNMHRVTRTTTETLIERLLYQSSSASKIGKSLDFSLVSWHVGRNQIPSG